MRSSFAVRLAVLLAGMGDLAPVDPRRQRLLDAGWIPLGADAGTGLEGWGKVIDGRAVTVPIHEAIEIEAKAARK